MKCGCLERREKREVEISGAQGKPATLPASQCKVAAKGSASGSSAGQWPVASVRELLRVFDSGVIKFRKKTRSLCCLEKWRPAPHHRRTYPPNTAFEEPDPVALAMEQSFARVNVDANDLIFVCGIDTQVAFHATGPPAAFHNMFALEPIEAKEVDFARVIDQGVVDSTIKKSKRRKKANALQKCKTWKKTTSK